MNQLLHNIKWDFLLQQRYSIVTASFLVTFLYVVAFLSLPSMDEEILIAIIFSDPAGLGMIFIGGLYLFEKTENTLQAVVVMPQPDWHYLASKVFTLTFLAIVCSAIMAVAGYGWNFNYAYFAFGIGGSASLFTFLGFTLVAYCRTFNEYIMKMAGTMLPVILPFLNLFNVTDTLWWYVVPVQASLLLLQRAFGISLTGWQTAYAVFYLLLWNYLAYRWAMRAYLQQRAK